MRISDLGIDGFGVWTGLELADLPDQLCVVFGPNEAGKTTLLEFVRSILYGFSADRRARYLPPLGGGRPGGWIRLTGDDKRVWLARYADDGSEAGRLVANDGRGEVPAAPALAELLGDLDEPTFTGAFAIGLKELQELGTLGDTEAARWLFDLSLGLEGISLGEVLRELQAMRNRLLAADDRPSVVGQLLSQQRRLDQEIDELADRTPRYVELVQQREQAERELARGETDLKEWRRRLQVAELAAVLGPKWRRRAQLDEQLAATAHLSDLPGDTLERLARVRGERAACRKRWQRLGATVKKLRAHAAACQVHDVLVRQAARIEALAEQQPWLESLSARIGAAATAVEEIEFAREADREQLGLKSAGEKGPAKTIPAAALQSLRAIARARRAARDRLRAAQAELASGRQSAEETQRQLQAALGRRADGGLAKALEQAGELVSNLRRRVQLDSRLEMWQLQHGELEHQVQAAVAGQLVPDRLVIAWGIGFAAATTLMLAGLLLPRSLTGGWGWPLFFAGGLGIVGIVLGRRYLMQAARARLVGARQQLLSLDGQMRQALADRDALDRLLPAGGGPLAVRLQHAERELAALEALAPAVAQSESTRRQSANVQETIRQARAERANLHKRWRQTLQQAGLPADFRPGQLKLLLAKTTDLAAHDEALAERAAELARRRRERDMLAGRIRGLYAEIALDAPSDDPLEQLQHLRSQLSQHKQRHQERQAILDRLARVRRRRRKLRGRAAKLARGRDLLLKATGAASIGQLRQRLERLAERTRLRDERTQLEHELAAALAGSLAADDVKPLLAEGADPQAARDEAAQRLAALEASAAKLHERRGQIRAQLTALADDRRAADKQLDRNVLSCRIEQSIDRWRTLAVAGYTLGQVRDYFQHERQPQTLREASVWLSRLTGGKYVRVWTPLEARELCVDEAGGRSLSVDALSRGTREQLFLSLRLALASYLAAQGTRVPLVLDDILVNFDTARTKAAAAVLRDFAKAGHQVLLLTCHEHVAKLFKSLRVEVRQLGGPIAVGDEPEPVEEPVEVRPRRRVRERPAPEPPPEPAVVVAEAPAPPPESQPEQPVERSPLRPHGPQPPIPRPHVEFRASEPPRVAAIPAPPAPTAQYDPTPAPAKPPVRARVVRATAMREREFRQQRWSAEEFDGELADRVSVQRQPAPADEEEAA